MNSTLSINSSFSTPHIPLPLSHRISAATTGILRPPHLLFPHKTLNKNFAIRASASNNLTPSSNPPNPSIPPLKAAACAVVFAAAAFGKFPHFHAKAGVLTPSQTVTEDSYIEEEEETAQSRTQTSLFTKLLETSPDAIDALKKLLQEKLDAGEDKESLSILKKLSAAQPENPEWKFLIARVLNELGKLEEARDTFEEILSQNPLSFEALLENALLMDKSGERDAVMMRLERALEFAKNEKKMKEARDIKLIMAQMQFLQKNVDDALRRYDELAREDPSDFRPYFCKGMIFSLMDKNVEAREQFAKYRELSPKKFEVEGYLRTPLSRMKLFGTDEKNRA